MDNNVKLNASYQKLEEYSKWSEKLTKQQGFIAKKIREGDPETALMQFQIDLRKGLKMQSSSDNITNLIKNIDEKIVAFHKGTVAINELTDAIWKFDGNLRKEIISEYDRLERLENLFEIVEKMIDNGDDFPSFVLPEKFRDSFEN